jgi:ribosomal protein S18 acetylase RimI-like enzyme
MIILQKMTSAEFKKTLVNSIESYAKEKTDSGNWKKSEAITKAKEEFATLLPQGLETENHYLYTVMDQDRAVGMIWLAKKPKDTGFIYEIKIAPEYQGLGYGKAAMLAIEVKAKELGMKRIKLHVFGHNQTARNLYEKLAYKTTNVLMAKDLS